jgi:hypothetical protein
MDVEISTVKEDPGSGSMVDCLVMKASAPSKQKDEENGEITLVVEVYPSSEGVEPRATKTESFTIKKAY